MMDDSGRSVDMLPNPTGPTGSLTSTGDGPLTPFSIAVVPDAADTDEADEAG